MKATRRNFIQSLGFTVGLGGNDKAVDGILDKPKKVTKPITDDQ